MGINQPRVRQLCVCFSPVPWATQWGPPLPDIGLMALLVNKTEHLFFPQSGLFLCQQKLCGVGTGCLFLEFCPVAERAYEGFKILDLSGQFGRSRFRGLNRPWSVFY